MMQRARTRLAAMAYAQKANAIRSIASSICDCMLAPLVMLTGMLIMVFAFWAYAIAAALVRVRCIIREGEA